jgi:hypothetical protein
MTAMLVIFLVGKVNTVVDFAKIGVVSGGMLFIHGFLNTCQKLLRVADNRHPTINLPFFMKQGEQSNASV